ncbi:hypothetical protein QBC44DRAFT_288426 [Cladorrhinum sp. PSN332]|nr:hypothetical protein QBC44DRAFT_288426 [Cladorrhinum sp. PSN332]
MSDIKPTSLNGKTTPSCPATPPHPLGKLIQTLKVDEITKKAKTVDQRLEIDEFQFVASYNWIKGAGSNSEPKIVIPGKPPLWTPHTSQIQLKTDSGFCPNDKCASLYPDHPMEPAVAAVLKTDPEAMKQAEVMACNRVLHNLFLLARGEASPFRMLVEKVGNTVYLIRREKCANDGYFPRGYGQGFARTSTTRESDVKGSATHQRVIRYRFAGLDMLVRFEADGYTKPESTPPSGNPTKTAGEDDTLDRVADLMSETEIPEPQQPQPARSDAVMKPEVIVQSDKEPVPHARLFDLKTRSAPKKRGRPRDHVGEQMPRLWIAQIPSVVIAWHYQGLFKPETTFVVDVRERVKMWEAKNQKGLRKYAALLRWVCEVVGEKGRRVEVVYSVEGEGEGEGDGERVLEVREWTEEVKRVVSEEVMRELEGGNRRKEEDSLDGEVDFTNCDEDKCGFCGKCEC